MTYKGYKIQAEVPTMEVWDIYDDGSMYEWVEDLDYMGDPTYIIKDANGEYLISIYGDLLAVREYIDGLAADASLGVPR